ncbi:P22 phage major capsid protein family protein, partial [Streptomyces sp. NPDC058964]
MANTFLTPDLIATRALATLYDTTVMAQLVHRDYDSDFRGRVGDTVTVRKPAVFTAQEFNRSTGIQPQDAVEGSV